MKQIANPAPNIRHGAAAHPLVNGIKIKLTTAPMANIFTTSILTLSFILTPFLFHSQNKI